MDLNMDSVIKLITNSTLCTIVGEVRGEKRQRLMDTHRDTYRDNGESFNIWLATLIPVSTTGHDTWCVFPNFFLILFRVKSALCQHLSGLDSFPGRVTQNFLCRLSYLSVVLLLLQDCSLPLMLISGLLVVTSN